MSALPVLTPAQSNSWDRSATRPLATLMESAGRAVAQLTLERFASAAAQGVLVACGQGNNGGDGWVAASALHALGVPIWVTELGAPDGGVAGEARRAALAAGVRTVPADGPWPAVGVIIDALLGTGARGVPRGGMGTLLDRMVDLEIPIVAVDGPTGLDLETGVHYGPLVATLTITFGGVRRGHLLARDEIGDLVVVDIGLGNPDSSWPLLIDGAWAARRMPPFAAASHKGTRGRVVIVGGAPAMTGAARLAARAAFGAGAGLVHVVAPEESLITLRMAEPDVQTLEHEFTSPLSVDLQQLLAKADAVVVGPGLGREEGRTAFVREVIAVARQVVIDADALTVLRGSRDALRQLASDRAIVCTPHVGEFRTLFPECGADIETAPWEAALAASSASGVTVLLKGVPTVIASPSGAALTVAAGNPGLATGGSGDVLSGIIAALLAQGIELPDAAAVGAQALGEAADHAARRVTARAMRPMDVVQSLPDVWRAWGRLRHGAPLRVPVLLELLAPRAI